TATGKTVTVWGEFSRFGWGVMQSISFSDGVSWTQAQLKQMLLDQQNAATSGSICGYADRNDTLVAGLGNKYLAGEGGSDTYIYTSAGGNYIIDDGGSAPPLVMQFIASTGVPIARPTFPTRRSTDLTATGKTVTVWGEFSRFGWGVMQSISFSDGVSWS